MKVTKEDAVAICQDYGLATADGWDEKRLAKKFGEVLRLFRSGEYDCSDKELLPILEGLVEGEEFELVDELDDVGKETTEPEDDEDDWDLDDEDEDEKDVEEVSGPWEGDPKDCPLQGGERVLVHDSEETWKGIVKEAMSDCRVMVRDRKGGEWDTAIEKCEVVKKGRSSKEKIEDDQDRQIRELEERLKAAKGGKSKGKRKGKKLSRLQMALKVLQESGEPSTIEDLAELAEAEYVDQGRQENLKTSVTTMKRLVKYGVLFGVVRQKGAKVKWVSK
jgi:hypothetical protein